MELGSRQVRGKQGALKVKKDTFQYVPLLKGLKTFLSNKEIFDEVSIHVIVIKIFLMLCR